MTDELPCLVMADAEWEEDMRRVRILRMLSAET